MTNIVPFEIDASLTCEQSAVEPVLVSTQRTLPPAPFPRKYVLSVFVNLQNARNAAQALYAAGFEERNIHALESHDFAEAVSRGQSPLDFLTSMDYDVYLREARCGRSFLAVRPTSSAQLKQIRNVLASHHAYHAAYINTWTKTELIA